MSRTGTSLLYQLLFGHPDIFFPPYRVQIACSNPLGFPLNTFHDNSNFNSVVARKTTMPVNINRFTDWSNINIKHISDLHSKDSIKKNINNNFDSAIEFLDNQLNTNYLNEEYYCIHDDHLYIFGVECMNKYKNSKIITNIRNPIDMLASKKNMLLFHIHGSANPLDYDMNDKAIKKELSRAIFSWIVASYEFSKKNCLPVLFEHIKEKHRSEMMHHIVRYLKVKYNKVLETDQNDLNFTKNYNELLFAGSSLNKLTKGSKNTTIGSYKVCLTKKEKSIISSLIDVDYFNSIVNENPNNFLRNFTTFWRFFDTSSLPHVSAWLDMYLSRENDKLFKLYSSFNYGIDNAHKAFSK